MPLGGTATNQDTESFGETKSRDFSGSRAGPTLIVEQKISERMIPGKEYDCHSQHGEVFLMFSHWEFPMQITTTSVARIAWPRANHVNSAAGSVSHSRWLAVIIDYSDYEMVCMTGSNIAD